ncbi:MAG: RNA polymerase sigma factor RpoH [Pseudomonadota bacterium]
MSVLNESVSNPSALNTGYALKPFEVAAPGVNLESYIHAVNNVAVLSAEEEQALANRFFYDKDLDAARQLVLAHLKFVVYIARGYSGYGLNHGDLIQEGNVGLMKAVKRFDPTMGVRLVSFAVHWIKAEIHEFVLKNWRIVKIATTKAQRKLFFNLRGMKKRVGRMTQDEMENVAQELGVSVTDVREMEGRLYAKDFAFDGYDDDNEESAPAPADFLQDYQFDPALTYAHDSSEENETSNLQEALEALDHRSRDIIQRRWLADTKATLHQLADEYGITAERIRQLEQNAMKKLRSSIDIPDFEI